MQVAVAVVAVLVKAVVLLAPTNELTGGAKLRTPSHRYGRLPN